MYICIISISICIASDKGITKPNIVFMETIYKLLPLSQFFHVCWASISVEHLSKTFTHSVSPYVHVMDSKLLVLVFFQPLEKSKIMELIGIFLCTKIQFYLVFSSTKTFKHVKNTLKIRRGIHGSVGHFPYGKDKLTCVHNCLLQYEHINLEKSMNLYLV